MIKSHLSGFKRNEKTFNKVKIIISKAFKIFFLFHFYLTEVCNIFSATKNSISHLFLTTNFR